MRIAIIGFALTLGGCATVTRGMTDQLTIESDPPGAKAVTSEGHTCPETPCTFTFDRKAEFVVSFTKDGYKRQDISVKTQIAGSGAAGFAGNILLGGVVGMGVDAATGATLEHTPNPVIATLVPDEPAAPGPTVAWARKLAKRPRPVVRVEPEEAPTQ